MHLSPQVYPARVVSHIQAARDAKTNIYALRREPGHKDIAKAIADEHASRRLTSKQRRD